MGTESKFVVITGVSRGLGRAMTEEFIARGHVVAGCGRSAKPLQELRDQFPPPHSFTELDVTNAPRVSEWGNAVLERNLPDLLVNNAAIINRSAPLWELTPQEFRAVTDVNINGVFNVIHAFVPAMVRKNRGVIVNFSSGWGRSTSPEVAPYCATKWAMEGLTQAMAQELPHGMAAVALNPGVIDTEMLRSCFGGSAGSYQKPETWAQSAVTFLLGLGPRQNGQSLTVAES